MAEYDEGYGTEQIPMLNEKLGIGTAVGAITTLILVSNPMITIALAAIAIKALKSMEKEKKYESQLNEGEYITKLNEAKEWKADEAKIKMLDEKKSKFSEKLKRYTEKTTTKPQNKERLEYGCSSTYSSLIKSVIDMGYLDSRNKIGIELVEYAEDCLESVQLSGKYLKNEENFNLEEELNKASNTLENHKSSLTKIQNDSEKAFAKYSNLNSKVDKEGSPYLIMEDIINKLDNDAFEQRLSIGSVEGTKEFFIPK